MRRLLKVDHAKQSDSDAHQDFFFSFFFFACALQGERTNEFDSKQLLSGNYPGIMYHHVITPDKIQSL